LARRRSTAANRSFAIRTDGRSVSGSRPSSQTARRPCWRGP
jgi:hypothetical protein